MRRLKRMTGIGWVVLGLLASPVSADDLYFKSGETLRGLVVEEHHDRIVLNTEEGEKTILRGDLDEIFYSEPERNYLYIGNRALEDGELSTAEGLFRKALQLNSRLQEAQEALERLKDLKAKRSKGSPVADPLPVQEQQLGLVLSGEEPLPLVAQVSEGSSAQRSGIQPGDRLVACWDFSLAYLPIPEAAQRLIGPAGSTVRLTLQRQVQLPRIPRGIKKPWPQMKLAMDRLGLTVAQVEKSGIADRSGLQSGDRIVRIQDRSTRYLPLHEAQRQVDLGRSRGILLTIQRNIHLKRK